MMQSGILEEAKLVYDHRDTYRTAAQAIGYKEFFPYFEGTADLESCLAHLKQASRNYAKRQLTWFRRQTLCGFTWKTETWNSRRQNRPKRSWRKTTLEMQEQYRYI